MALPQVLTGTWEEIKLRDAELAGKFLRVIVDTDSEPPQAGEELAGLETDSARVAHIKSLRGKYAHLGVSVEDLHRERQADKAQEEQQLEGGDA